LKSFFALILYGALEYIKIQFVNGRERGDKGDKKTLEEFFKLIRKITQRSASQRE